MQQSEANESTHVAVRGVWRAPYLQDGYPVVIAVDSRGRRIASVVMARGTTPSVVRRMLQDLLDAVDPQLRLRLVKPDGQDPSRTNRP